jgi:hypothetical protein
LTIPSKIILLYPSDFSGEALSDGGVMIAPFRGGGQECGRHPISPPTRLLYGFGETAVAASRKFSHQIIGFFITGVKGHERPPPTQSRQDG